MNISSICTNIDLVKEYELLRAQILAVGESSPLSRTDRCIISDGLYQWAQNRQANQKKTTGLPYQETMQAAGAAHGIDYHDVEVVNLIASMAIQSITRNQRVA